MTWGATHVLSHEEGGRMVEVMVRRDREGLYTVEEWTGGAPPDWTIGQNGTLRRKGRRFRRRATLRAIVPSALRLGDVLDAVDRGARYPAEIARMLGRSELEVEQRLRALARLGEVRRGERGGVERVSPPARAAASGDFGG